MPMFTIDSLESPVVLELTLERQPKRPDSNRTEAAKKRALWLKARRAHHHFMGWRV